MRSSPYRRRTPTRTATRTSSKRRSSKSTPAPTKWLFIGVILGVGITIFLYHKYSELHAIPKEVSESVQKRFSEKPTKPRKVKRKIASSPKFDFYSLLSEEEKSPNKEDVIEDKPKPIVIKSYLIAVDHNPTLQEADRIKAELAFLGITSHIEKAQKDQLPFHQVVLGPYKNQAEARSQQKHLLQAGLSSALIPQTNR